MCRRVAWRHVGHGGQLATGSGPFQGRSESVARGRPPWWTMPPGRRPSLSRGRSLRPQLPATSRQMPSRPRERCRRTDRPRTEKLRPTLEPYSRWDSAPERPVGRRPTGHPRSSGQRQVQAETPCCGRLCALRTPVSRVFHVMSCERLANATGAYVSRRSSQPTRPHAFSTHLASLVQTQPSSRRAEAEAKPASASLGRRDGRAVGEMSTGRRAVSDRWPFLRYNPSVVASDSKE